MRIWRKITATFCAVMGLFSSSKPLANDPDKYGEQLACMYVSCKKARNDSWFCCSVIGQKKTKVFWHQSEARTGLAVWNWSVKTLSPGALLLVLDFSSPEFFFARFRLFPVPTNCPWVSEDGTSRALWEYLYHLLSYWKRRELRGL